MSSLTERLLRLAKISGITFALCSVISILFIAAFIYIKDGPRPEWHEALNRLHDDIHLGMTRNDVNRAIDSFAWPPGKAPSISRYANARRWTIESPFEFPATNWILFIDFVDTSVFRVGMGTLDSLDHAPGGARPMKVNAQLAALEEAYEAKLRTHEALKSEVARMIRHARPITDVHLSVPFIESGDSSAMTASCVVTFLPGRFPSDSDIQAIRRLIVDAFPPLTNDKLVLSDGSGRPLNDN